MSNKFFYKGWQDVLTLQSKEIISELMDAKKHRKALLLISQTGGGKTHVIDMFQKKMPEHTYAIKVGYSYKLVDIVDELVSLLGINMNFGRVTSAQIRLKLNAIASKLRDIKKKGGKPVIIIDEGENLLPASLKMIKELYDFIIHYCSIVLIGTDQILDSILNRKQKNRQSVPQLWRRFKAGTREISAINKARDFKAFFDLYIPNDADLQDLLIELCENYGELHDYLHPVLCYCAEKNEPINEKVFRLYHKLSKQSKPLSLKRA